MSVTNLSCQESQSSTLAWAHRTKGSGTATRQGDPLDSVIALPLDTDLRERVNEIVALASRLRQHKSGVE
jgi:hypothetical protein